MIPVSAEDMRSNDRGDYEEKWWPMGMDPDIAHVFDSGWDAGRAHSASDISAAGLAVFIAAEEGIKYAIADVPGWRVSAAARIIQAVRNGVEVQCTADGGGGLCTLPDGHSGSHHA